jgi:hypothetical protein
MTTRAKDVEVSGEKANGGRHKRAGTVVGILEPNRLVEVEDQWSLAKRRIFLQYPVRDCHSDSQRDLRGPSGCSSPPKLPAFMDAKTFAGEWFGAAG